MFKERTSGGEGCPIEFSGIVITYNEARRLRECLNSLAFCEQLLVVDLGSKDGSLEIVRECGAELIEHAWVPIVEQVWPYAVSLARHEWVLLLDPDEVLPAGIEDDFRRVITENPDLGAMRVPWQFFFKGRALHCTVWGQRNTKMVVQHKARVEFSAGVHRGRKVLPGYRVVELPGRDADYCGKHYWVDSYRELFEKHMRYIKLEGESRYNAGQRFSWFKAILSTGHALEINLIDNRGLLGGFNGIFLSLFYTWYVWMGWLSLRQYGRRQNTQA